MPASARLETVLGRLQLGHSLVGETFRDNNTHSQYFGKNYTVGDVKLSPKLRICLQVTYDFGERGPRLLDSSSDDIHIPNQPPRKSKHRYSPDPPPSCGSFSVY